MKSIKLNNLIDNNLSTREMKELKGGKACGCSCYYANSGGASTNDNGSANFDGDLCSPNGTVEFHVIANKN